MSKFRTLLASAAFLLMGCFGCATTPQASWPVPPNDLKLDYDISQMLYRIQEEYERETTLCLTGYVVNNSIYVTGIFPPGITERTHESVNFNFCRHQNSVGMYHNHPPAYDDSEHTAVYYCRLSDQDVYTLNHLDHLWVSIITCDDKGTLVWHFKHANSDLYWTPRIPPS